ncbi:MAG: uncharacterized protein A8A55_0896 [Amphiamblys sp. WSBS2006]|nr:MAG: uncharacterized protein A8A55_0896 [Amphiamblys sp. WSBS2006]
MLVELKRKELFSREVKRQFPAGSMALMRLVCYPQHKHLTVSTSQPISEKVSLGHSRKSIFGGGEKPEAKSYLFLRSEKEAQTGEIGVGDKGQFKGKYSVPVGKGKSFLLRWVFRKRHGDVSLSYQWRAWLFGSIRTSLGISTGGVDLRMEKKLDGNEIDVSVRIVTRERLAQFIASAFVLFGLRKNK